jgi:hypothetical protein
MEMLLRKYAEWKAKRKAAQVIIFDGAAEIDKTKAFAKGTIVGMLLTTFVYVLIAPSAVEPGLMREVSRREALLDEANQRVDEAVMITNLCLSTAQGMERTLESYQRLLLGR